MIGPWIGFTAVVVALLVLDLAVIHRDPKTITTKSALGWVAFFVGTALAFNVAVYFAYDRDWLGLGTSYREHRRHYFAARHVLAGELTPEEAKTWTPPPESPEAEGLKDTGLKAATRFLAGWLTEYALSIDNIFVIAVIFGHFAVPPAYQRRVLFWGILGALVMRGVMILAGTALLDRFVWLLYVFGAFLLFTALKMLISKAEDDEGFQNRRIIRWTRRLFTVSPGFDSDRFFTRLSDGRFAATPLLLVLVVIEFTDLVFALDSIPAVLGITTDPFLVFTSNVFAILGLRSLFFALSGMIRSFHYLKYSLAAILGFVGVRMVASMPAINIRIPSRFSLLFIASALLIGIAASVVQARRENRAARASGQSSPRS